MRTIIFFTDFLIILAFVVVGYFLYQAGKERAEKIAEDIGKEKGGEK